MFNSENSGSETNNVGRSCRVEEDINGDKYIYIYMGVS